MRREPHDVESITGSVPQQFRTRKTEICAINVPLRVKQRCLRRVLMLCSSEGIKIFGCASKQHLWFEEQCSITKQHQCTHKYQCQNAATHSQVHTRFRFGNQSAKTITTTKKQTNIPLGNAAVLISYTLYLDSHQGGVVTFDPCSECSPSLIPPAWVRYSLLHLYRAFARSRNNVAERDHVHGAEAVLKRLNLRPLGGAVLLCFAQHVVQIHSS